MRRTQPLRFAVGKAFFVLFLQFFFLQSQSQTFTTITYAGSGLPVNTNGAQNVLAGDPTVGGYVNTLLSYFDPPQFDGTSLILESPTFYDDKVYIEAITAININYAFQQNYTYYITLNYSVQFLGDYNGVGISLGTPQLTTDQLEMGTAMNNYPINGSSVGFNDSYLANPIYSTWIPINSASPTSLTIPPIPITTPTTGLNLESLPDVFAGWSSLNIQSIVIVGVPSISAASSTICSSGTLSVTNPNNWPVSWSVSPTSIASITPSGNSATVTKVSNGSATVTATYTAPNGNTYAATLPVQVGILPEPLNISPSSGTTAPNAVDAFIAIGANHWAAYPGTITGGQGTDAASVQVANVSSGTLSVVASATNACGANGSRIATLTIESGGGHGFLNYSSWADSGSAAALPDSPIPINGPVLYPNPATTSLQVLIPETDFTKTYIKLYDIKGNLIRAIIPNSQATTIDLSRLAKGTYVVTIFDGQKTTTKLLNRQ